MTRTLLDAWLRPTWQTLGSAQAARTALRTLAATWRARPDAVPPPAALGLDVSDECNLTCAVCSRTVTRDRRAAPLLELPRFQVVFEAVRPAYLLLSGYGEPLLNPDLPAMVRHARRRGARATVITNGTLLGTDEGRRLADAGPARVRVSLDAAAPDRYAHLRRGGDLPAVLAGLRAFLARPRPARVDLQLVVCRQNLEEIVPFVHLCRTLPGAMPTFLLAFTYGRPEEYGPIALPRGTPGDPEVTRALAAIAEARRLCQASGYARAAAQLDDIRLELTEDLSSAPCCMPWYQTLVATDGRLFPCCHHSIHGEALGDVFTAPFAEVWNGPGMSAFRKRLLSHRAADPVCATCGHQDRALHRALHPLGRRGEPRP